MDPRLFFRLAYQAVTHSKSRQYVRLSLHEINQAAQAAAVEENISILLDLFEELNFRRLEPNKIWTVKDYIIEKLAAIDEIKLSHLSSAADLACVRSKLITRYRIASSRDKIYLPESLETMETPVAADTRDSPSDRKQTYQPIDFHHVESDNAFHSDLQANEAVSLETNHTIDLLLRRIASGKAILFTGAGFSRGTTNIDDLEPPLATELAIKICEAGNFPACDDLRFAADYYLSKY